MLRGFQELKKSQSKYEKQKFSELPGHFWKCLISAIPCYTYSKNLNKQTKQTKALLSSPI